MNIFFWLFTLSFSILNAEQSKTEQTITIANNIPTEISSDLKLEWWRLDEGKPRNFEEKSSNVFPSHPLKFGNQQFIIPESATLIDISGTTNKAKKIDKKSKLDRCTLILGSQLPVTPGKTYTLTSFEKCDNTGLAGICQCYITLQ